MGQIKRNKLKIAPSHLENGSNEDAPHIADYQMAILLTCIRKEKEQIEKVPQQFCPLGIFPPFGNIAGHARYNSTNATYDDQHVRHAYTTYPDLSSYNQFK